MKCNLCVTVLFIFSVLYLAPLEVFAQDQTRRNYYVGNSLTDHIYKGSAALAATQGFTEQYSRAWMPGAPLSWIWPWYVDNGNNLLATEHWDNLSLQPFDRDIHDATEGDSVMCLKFMNAAKVKNPDIQTYIYSHWMRKPQDGGSYTAQQWNTFWLQTTGSENKKFYEDLVVAVRAGSSGVKPARIVPVGDVMYSLNQKMIAGTIPGFTSIWQLYEDGIHVVPAGSYLVGITYLATMYKVDPRGVPVPTTYGTISQH